MRTLIFGANGQVGRELVKEATFSGSEFLALDKTQLDISDVLLLENAIVSYRPDVVINAAAFTAVDKAEVEQNSAYKINRDAVGDLASICASQSVALIHLSTDYVFDGSKGEVYSEDDIACAQSVYGISKLQGEVLVRELLREHIILRTSWVFSVHGKNFLKTIINKARDKQDLSVVSDQYGGPTPADLIAKVIFVICKKIKTGDAVWGTYHFSGLPHTTWHGFAREILHEAADLGFISPDVMVKPIGTSQYKTLAVRPLDSRMSNTKIKKTFGIKDFSYKSSLIKIIKQLME